ncbi:fungal-specific transcription factor domain-containing protein [Aspergillus pseudotamarii]|uniref:Fungal-specific transcription factor domain-containing protein n=1 Tax=Aspergillus pseudotamarii TaxID=132259 RepID=A0A5N6SWB2_ASPPS|nr:fungal-specific transcription factor domain-containing protein [Aspergillus pseudotamarii]KAE8138912.1 fungal-specific transcription factor domain-containing protein [Aspergillus pseudotamarii]
MDTTSYPGDDSTPSSNLPERPTKRPRKKAPKSRNGCARCKKRRIKCDEKHPACDNCIKFGCQCPGFQQNLRWSKKYQRVGRPSAVDNPEETVYPSAVVASSIQQAGNADNELVPLDSSNTSQNDLNGWSVDDDPSTLPVFPDSWLFTLEDCGVFLDHDGSPEEETTSVQDGTLAVLNSPNGSDVTTNPAMLRTPTHLSTMLIEHWFAYVCPLWSAFDSAVSYSRQLALSTWGSSKAVFYTMQAMSAAYISVTMPHFDETLHSLKSLAVGAIEEETRLVRRSPSPKVKADLVYAVFTLGNSVNWTASGMDENPWLGSARELMSMWSLDMSISDAPIHAYFCQALTYWEMLLAARGCGSVPGKLAKKRQRYYAKIQQAMGLSNSSDDNNNDPYGEPIYGPGPAMPGTGTRPNSWSGVSNEVIDVFGQVLALCYHAHHSSRKSQGNFNTKRATLGLCDVSLAHELQRDLLNMDFESLILIDEVHGFPVQTQDDNTPIAHLLQTAEAYRQAALLQLHLSFHDLTMTSKNTLSGLTEARPGNIGDTVVGDGESRKEDILSMTLHLINILERIPGQSGSRSLHLMLYLSAVAGLQVDTSFVGYPESNHGPEGRGAGDRYHGPATSEPFNRMIAVDAGSQDLLGSNTAASVDRVVTRSTLEVSRARQFILARLGSLRQTLPHRRVDSTIEFAKDIWKQYDTQGSQPYSIVYWLDVMTEKGSRVTLW